MRLQELILVKRPGYLCCRGLHLDKATEAAHRSTQPKDVQAQDAWEMYFSALEFHAKAEMFTEKKDWRPRLLLDGRHIQICLGRA